MEKFNLRPLITVVNVPLFQLGCAPPHTRLVEFPPLPNLLLNMIMASPATGTGRTKAALAGTYATLLLTLYGRYLDAKSDEPRLCDKLTRLVLEKIDYDLKTIGATRGAIYLIGTRAQWIDSRILDFLS